LHVSSERGLLTIRLEFKTFFKKMLMYVINYFQNLTPLFVQ